MTCCHSLQLPEVDEDVGDVSQPLLSYDGRRAQISGETSLHLHLSMTSAVRHTGTQLRGFQHGTPIASRVHAGAAGQNKEVKDVLECPFDVQNSVLDLGLQVSDENFMK